MSLAITEKFARRHARRIAVNGNVALTTNGDPLLLEAFEALGWLDPYVEVEIERVEPIEGPPEAAVVTAPEIAVLESPEGHVL
jgi:hypothetical protein